MSDNTRYLSATREEFLRLNGAAETTEPLGMQTIQNAAVGPWRPNIRLKKQPIKNLKIWKCAQLAPAQDLLIGKAGRKPPRRENYMDKDVILLGYAESFFGHFLADSMSRAWVTLDEKYADAEFVAVRSPDMTDFMEKQARELYALAGVKNLTLIREKTRFKSVTIPDSSFDYSRGLFHKKFADTFARIADGAACGRIPGSPVARHRALARRNNTKKIYLSRTHLDNNPTLGEEGIEKIFKDNGYAVVHPQELPLRDMINAAANAAHIAGLEGTALHYSLFSRDGINLICINRYNAAIPMQILIDKLKGINATYIDASVDPFSQRKNESPLTIVGLNGNMRRFLDDNGFGYDADAMRAADVRNMKIFMKIWRARHRWLPKWLAQFITVLIPLRKWRKSARRALGVSFQGITRKEISDRVTE
ncbi:MAG: glycosyltransferase family 61 protein [Proteobacteria bacterium]|nr:glycosyltransferase family 61 protein [Pseudomonadota bacterium]